MADQQEAMASLSQQSSRESAGTTSLGALLRAKLDNSGKSKAASGRVTGQLATSGTNCPPLGKPQISRRGGFLMRPFSLDNAMPQDSMTRSDLVEELAARFGQLTHKDAEFAVKTILTPWAKPWSKAIGSRSGLWQFSVNHRPPRMGRNPRSGEAVAIPEKRVPTSSQAKPCAKR